MSILFHCEGDKDDQLFHAIKARLPQVHIDKWPDCQNPASVTTAMVWKAPDNFFDELENLKHVLSIAAGIDHLMSHRGLPKNADIIRLADAGMAATMSEYVLYGVLHAQRQMHLCKAAEEQQMWIHETASSLIPATEFKVGILGAGQLGSKVAKRLQLNGYRISCWSQNPKNLENIQHFVGKNALKDMLGSVHVIVCLLPLTEHTRHILNANTFSQMREGTFIINAGRGDHIDEAALLAALNTGHLSGALLDVFSTEPLPADNALWTHPRVTVTPHIAAPTDIDGAITQLTETVQLLSEGRRPTGFVDRQRGY